MVDYYDMGNWGSYTNIRYGIQFSVPKNWLITGNAETGEYNILENEDWSGPSVGVMLKSAKKESIEKTFSELKGIAEQSIKYYQEHPDGPATRHGEPELVTVAGEKAVKQSYQPYEIIAPGFRYFFPQAGFELDLSDVYVPGSESNKYTLFIHDKILSSFKFLGKLNYLGYGYYTDGKDIYFNYLEMNKDFRPDKWEDFDYFAEKNRKYFDDSIAEKVEGADINSFVTLNTFCGMGHCEGVAKDKNYIYVGLKSENTPDGRLNKADVKTFQYLKYNFYKDKNALYYYGMGWGRADYVDLATFEFIDYMYSKDKNNVYQFMDGFNIVKGADPKTFVVPKY
jgi:hypothetical protein